MFSNVLRVKGLLVLCLFSYGSFGKQKTVVSVPWAGRYKWTGGNYEMAIEQFGSELGVDIRNLDAPAEPPPGNLVASFVAHISGERAIFKELRDPKNCRVDLRRIRKGIILEDHCGGPDGGLYLEEK